MSFKNSALVLSLISFFTMTSAQSSKSGKIKSLEIRYESVDLWMLRGDNSRFWKDYEKLVLSEKFVSKGMFNFKDMEIVLENSLKTNLNFSFLNSAMTLSNNKAEIKGREIIEVCGRNWSISNPPMIEVSYVGPTISSTEAAIKMDSMTNLDNRHYFKALIQCVKNKMNTNDSDKSKDNNESDSDEITFQ